MTRIKNFDDFLNEGLFNMFSQKQKEADPFTTKLAELAREENELRMKVEKIENSYVDQQEGEAEGPLNPSMLPPKAYDDLVKELAPIEKRLKEISDSRNELIKDSVKKLPK